MFTILKKLSAAAPEPLNDADARLALAALMVRIARTDGSYDATESTEIGIILAGRYALGASEAEKLRQEAEEVEAEAPDTVRFTRAIKSAVSYEERASVVECLWRVVLADGRRDDDENALMRLVVNLLGVNDRDSALARQAVRARHP